MSDIDPDDVDETDVYDTFDRRGVAVNESDGDEGTETVRTVAILDLPRSAAPARKRETVLSVPRPGVS